MRNNVINDEWENLSAMNERQPYRALFNKLMTLANQNRPKPTN